MNKVRRYILIFAFVWMGCIAAVGQNVARVHRNSVERVKSMYEHSMYSAVRDEAARILETSEYLRENDRAALAAYMIKSAILMSAPNVDALMLEYEAQYRQAPEFMNVYLMYAGYYFEAEDYVRTLDILEDMEYSMLSRKDKEKYLYYRSFCQLRTGLTKDAQTGFGMLASGRHNIYTTSAVYYLGYISYLNKEYAEAVGYLERVRDDDHFGQFCKYYIQESKLILQDYDYVVEHAADVMDAVDSSMKSKVARIVSEAYYRTDRPKEAKKWFDSYSSSSGELSRKDDYFLGIVSYSLESYAAAIESFEKVLDEPDSLSQSAYLHMANSYLKLKNKHDALKNYAEAAQMHFDERVREDAYFNFAKLSFDINSDISAFEDYLRLYPGTTRSDEIYSYMATSYLLSKKYSNAVEVLGKVKDLTVQMTVNLQKAAFLRGMELFGRGAYNGAVSNFLISQKYGRYNYSVYMLSRFWQAEACFRMEDYTQALDIDTELYNTSAFRGTAEYPVLLFNLGYVQFRLADYPAAIDWFERFLAAHNSDMEMIMEAKLRIGDSYFMVQDYTKAASVYEEVSLVNYQSSSIMYAAYQSAICYGLISQVDKKMEILERLYERRDGSVIYPKAVYELGRTYVREGMGDDAERCFVYLLDDINDPLYNGKAMLELGMLYANKGLYDQAISSLTAIVEKMPVSEDAEDALAVLESIYVSQNRPEEFLAYLDRIGMSASKSEDEKELIIFNAAEQVFLTGDFVSAQAALRKYIENYPDGQKLPQAYFYLGESLQQSGQKEAAADAFSKVMNMGEGAFLELSTLYYARICFEMEQYEKAASAYEELEEIAIIEHNLYEAKRGQMLSYFHSGKNLSAIDAAAAVMGDSAVTAEDRLMSEYITAKCYIVLGQRDDALPLLEKLAEDKFSEYGAEAAYLLILDRYDSGLFEEVENMVYDFSDAKSGQAYWLAKSFIVLGDAFAERGDMEQAEATFRSLLDEYIPADAKDDVHEQVKMRLDKIEQMEADYE